jgi:hypothetical protein
VLNGAMNPRSGLGSIFLAFEILALDVDILYMISVYFTGHASLIAYFLSISFVSISPSTISVHT